MTSVPEHRESVSAGVLDEILTMQILVAWAGEGETDPPRLGWWRTSLVDEFGGQDLFERLMPHTWRWAVLEAARDVAKRVDKRSREATADADQLVSLFRFGFALDEQLDDRLAALKRTSSDPVEALPGLSRLADDWDAAAFAQWVAEHTGGDHAHTPSGRRLKGQMPHSPLTLASSLCAALAPLSAEYPAPHYRLGR